jgi:hypothetical protein
LKYKAAKEKELELALQDSEQQVEISGKIIKGTPHQALNYLVVKIDATQSLHIFVCTELKSKAERSDTVVKDVRKELHQLTEGCKSKDQVGIFIAPHN